MHSNAVWLWHCLQFSKARMAQFARCCRICHDVDLRGGMYSWYMDVLHTGATLVWAIRVFAATPLSTIYLEKAAVMDDPPIK